MQLQPPCFISLPAGDQWPLGSRKSLAATGKAILHSTISTDFLGHILQGQNHGAAFSEAGVGNLRDLMPDDLSETDLIIIEKVHNKCNKLESSPNHLPTSSLWKNCLPRNWILVPKKVGDRCSKQLRSSSNAQLIEQAHRNRKELETIALKYQFPTRLMLEEVTERTWLPADLRAEWAPGGFSPLPRAWNVHSAHHPPGSHLQGL